MDPHAESQRNAKKMASTIDMALDDIIKLKRTNTRRRSSAPQRRFPESSGPVGRASHSPARAAPYAYPAPPPMVRQMPWDTVLVDGGGSADSVTKLYVSNLDCDVTNEDIKLLFSDVGELKRYGIHCDRSGRSRGTAEVVYWRHEDAVSAIKRYNNARLDGKPVTIELVGTNLIPPNYYYGELYRACMGEQRPHGTIQGLQSNGDRGLSQGSSRRKSDNAKPTVEELDTDLERYRSKAVRHPK